jgi:hypothetical protein
LVKPEPVIVCPEWLPVARVQYVPPENVADAYAWNFVCARAGPE